ncbi:MAG: hypothetical protein ABIO38_03760 [Luteimonas sp.]
MKPFTTVTAGFLGLFALLQLGRFLLRWEITINSVSIPVWASAFAFLVAGGLALMLWKENRGAL